MERHDLCGGRGVMWPFVLPIGVWILLLVICDLSAPIRRA